MIDSPKPDAKIITISGEKPEKDGRGVIIVAVALGALILGCVGIAFRRFVYKHKLEV